jgi:Cu/Ag efflux pump CusA
LHIKTYVSLTKSPSVPNGQAYPQKNLPKKSVNAHKAMRIVTNEVNSTAFFVPNCVKIYLTPENAAVNADGKNIKNITCDIHLIVLVMYFLFLGFFISSFIVDKFI